MLKKTITYTDYNGITRTEDFYFNLSKVELTEMQMTTEGGLDVMLTNISNSKDSKAIFQVFKKIIMKAYGEKTPDGKRFMKSEDISAGFEQTEAYSILIMELLQDPEKMTKFIESLLPADLVAEAKKQQAAGKLPSSVSEVPAAAPENE